MLLLHYKFGIGFPSVGMGEMYYRSSLVRPGQSSIQIGPLFFNKMYTTAPCFTCSLCDRPLFLISVESNTLLFTRIKSRFCTVGSPSYEFIIIAFYDVGAGLVAVNM